MSELVPALCREFCACLGAECDHQRARAFLVHHGVLGEQADK